MALDHARLAPAMQPPSWEEVSSLDVTEIAKLARPFHELLVDLKATHESPGYWYPYDTFSNFHWLNRLLTGDHRRLLELVGDEPFADLGAGDGDSAFFFEWLGIPRVDIVTIDGHFPSALLLRDLLGSRAEVLDADLDEQFELPAKHYGLSLLLGVLYHLKNPLGALERIAKRSTYCLMSTRVMRVLPDKQADVTAVPVAYLFAPRESNNDPTNTWVFSHAGAHRLVERAGWNVLDFVTTNMPDSEPVSPTADERAFFLLRSTQAPA